jgi:protease-4
MEPNQEAAKPAIVQPSLVQPQLVTAVPPFPPKKKRNWLLGIFVLFLVLALGGSLLVNAYLFVESGSFDGGYGVQEKYFSHQRFGSNKVAILHVSGVILNSEGFVKRQIDQAISDDTVKAVVLRVDSPGGTVTGSDSIYHHLTKLAEKKPIVVSMGSMAASGGYYVSMAVGPSPETIYAEPTTWTGSIGVIIPHYDASGLMEKVGVKTDSIASHPLKGMASFTKPMTPQERKILQGLVDESFTRFKDIVKHGRPKFEKDPAALDRLATGQVFTADQAVQSGLVDKVGWIEDAIDRAIELAGLTEDNAHVVEYKREFSLMDAFLGEQSHATGLDPAALLEMATPRAYYLWSWMPPLFSSEQR